MIPIVSFPSTNHSLLISTVTFSSRLKSGNPSSAVSCRASAVSVVPPPPQVTLYEVLGVRRNASPLEIKTAYRSLAKRYHPDACSPAPGEESDARPRSFVEINDAYETLSDLDARAVYDSSTGLLERGNATSFSGGFSSVIVGSPGFRVNPTRKWETDQCW